MADKPTLNDFLTQKYQAGFTTDIPTDSAPPGLSESIY
jgi:hypothetical protein